MFEKCYLEVTLIEKKMANFLCSNEHYNILQTRYGTEMFQYFISDFL